MKKLLFAFFFLPGILFICLLGMFAALIGWRSLDGWCSRMLTDEQEVES